MFSKIVVPLDGSTAAECALPLVRALARRFAIAVELLSVIDLREISRDISAAEGLFLDQLVEYESRHSAEYLGKIATSLTLDMHCGNAKTEVGNWNSIRQPIQRYLR